MSKNSRTSSRFAPLHTWVRSRHGHKVPLPRKLADLYGTLHIPAARSAFVFSNFVSTLDGVVSLQKKGHDGGGDISGFNAQDRMVMGLLRAIADIIIVGSGTLAADPNHVWTPDAICPELAADYRQLRSAMGSAPTPLNVVVSASGRLNLRRPVFASGLVPALIITTRAGAKSLMKQRTPSTLEIRTVRSARGEIRAATLLDAVKRVNSGTRILVEGGPRLLASFYDERLMNEQFLSLAPQISGRDLSEPRLSLVMGKTFAPRNPLWGTLNDVRRGDRLLFLRYSF
jgi:riboflavin biosynthesis pyrimidine reductase